MRRLHRRNRVPTDELNIIDTRLINGFMSTGLVQDRSQSANDSTVTAALAAFPGFSFNGTSAYLEMPITALDNDIYTVLAWFKKDDLVAGKEIISILGVADNHNTERVRLSVTVAGNLQGFSDGQGLILVSAPVGLVAAGEWYLGGYTHDFGNQSAILYLDGSQVQTDTVFTQEYLNTNARTPRIGRRSIAYWNGSIGEIWIFNKILSAEETQSIFNVTKFRYGKAG